MSATANSLYSSARVMMAASARALAKALADASAYAFGVIQSKDCGIAEVSSALYNDAYASVMMRVEIYGMFTGVCTKCCGKP